MRQIEVELDGQVHRVWAERIGTQVWFHFQGQTFVSESEESSSRRSGKKASSHPGEIFAPMPGKVIKVNTKTGAQVRAGEVLIILEAMKMEYSLQADMDGVLESLNAKEGEQVRLGQQLLKIKAGR